MTTTERPATASRGGSRRRANVAGVAEHPSPSAEAVAPRVDELRRGILARPEHERYYFASHAVVSAAGQGWSPLERQGAKRMWAQLGKGYTSEAFAELWRQGEQQTAAALTAGGRGSPRLPAGTIRLWPDAPAYAVPVAGAEGHYWLGLRVGDDDTLAEPVPGLTVRVLSVVGDPDPTRGGGRSTNRARYTLELASGDEVTVTGGELSEDALGARFPALAVAGRRNVERVAQLVIVASRHPSTIRRRGVTGVGWKSLGDRRVVVLGDGSHIGGDGPGPVVEFALVGAPEHEAAPYQDGPPAFDLDAIAAALRFTVEEARGHRGTLAVCAGVRSLAFDVLASDVSLALVGPSGAGKTALGNWPRNLLGNFSSWPIDPTVSFTATQTGLELAIARHAGMPILVDDFAAMPSDGPHGVDVLAKKVDAIVCAAGNNTEVRGRASRDVTARPGNRVALLPVLTGEIMPPLKPSTLARMLYVPCEPGDVGALRTDAMGEHALGLRSFGYALVAWLARRREADDAAFAAELRAQHERFAAELRAELPEGQHPRSASNGAHFLVAAQLIEECCAELGISPEGITVEGLRPALVEHLTAQHRWMQAQTDGSYRQQTLAEWACEVTASALGKGAYKLESPTNGLPVRSGMPLEMLGYRSRSGEWSSNGAYLGNIWPEDNRAGFHPDVWWLFLADAAKRDGRTHQLITKRSFFAAMAEAGVIIPAPSGENVSQAWVDNKNKGRVMVPLSLLWPDDKPDDDEHQGNGPGPGSSGPGVERQGNGAEPERSERRAVEPEGPSWPELAYRMGRLPSGSDALRGLQLRIKAHRDHLIDADWDLNADSPPDDLAMAAEWLTEAEALVARDEQAQALARRVIGAGAGEHRANPDRNPHKEAPCPAPPTPTPSPLPSERTTPTSPPSTLGTFSGPPVSGPSASPPGPSSPPPTTPAPRTERPSGRQEGPQAPVQPPGPSGAPSTPAGAERPPTAILAAPGGPSPAPYLAGVLDVDGLHLASELVSAGLPAHVGELGDLARRHHLRRVIVHPRARAALGLDDTRPDDLPAAPFVASAEATHEVTALGGWARIERRGTQGEKVLAALVLGPDEHPLTRATDGPELLAAMRLFESAAGVEWVFGRGSQFRAMACDANRELWAIAERTSSPGPVLDEKLPEAANLLWSRALDADEAAAAYVHVYDSRSQYLAGAGSVILPVGEPRQSKRRFDPGVPGCWRIRRPVLDGLPNLAGGLDDDESAHVWLTTPTLAAIVETTGEAPEVTNAWCWPEGKRLLRPWYERTRAAVELLNSTEGPVAPLVLKQIKAMYAVGIGGELRSRRLAKQGSPLYQPAWSYFTMGHSAANLLRRVVKVAAASGRRPFRVDVDSLYYVSDDPDPIAGAPAGLPVTTGKLGHYKVAGSLPLALYLANEGLPPGKWAALTEGMS